jgi:hypothetical protein
MKMMKKMNKKIYLYIYTMSEYQARINAFRDNMASSSDAYNNAMANMKEFTQNALLDKVGAHAEYMAKVGGQVAAASAMVHGGIRGYKNIKKTYDTYKSKQRAKQNGGSNQETKTPTQQSQDDTTGLNRQAAVESGPPKATEQEQPEAEDIADATAKRQGPPKPEPEEEPAEPEASPARPAAPEFEEAFKGTSISDEALSRQDAAASNRLFDEADDIDAKVAVSRQNQVAEEFGATDRQPIPDRFTGPRRNPDPERPVPSSEQAGGGAMDIREPEPLTAADRSGTFGQELTSEETQKALKPISLDLGEEGPVQGPADNLSARIEQGAKAFEGTKPTPVGTDDLVAGAKQDVGNVLEGNSDFIGAAKEGGESLIKEMTTRVGSAVAKTVGSDALAAIGGAAAEAVPIVGEIAGVGMLIHQLVKAHKEKQEAEQNPDKAVPVLEPQEEAGGFDPKALMGGSGSGTMMV